MGFSRRHWVQRLIQVGLWWLAFVTLSLVLWIHQKFGNPTFDQLLFHVQLGFRGLLGAEYYVIKSFVVSCLLLPGVMAYIMSYRIHLKELFFAVPATCWLLACILLLNQVSFFAYAESLGGGQDYFSDHYQDPKQAALTGASPRNLILIYVESLDAAYSDTHLFGKDLLHSLDVPAPDSMSFAQYDQVPGTGWTIAGIVSTQCGVPLEPVTLYDGNAQGEKLRHFLPNAVCLGDVLDRFGYQNVFMGGASLAFAGKGQFLKDHHYAERYGREEWLARGDQAADMSSWGLNDDDLFRHAESKLDELEASGGRFNLTLLTLDTHYPRSGAISKYCAERKAGSFEDIVECTADQVADFVTYIRQKGYLKNVNIVILGDHLAMTNPVISQLTAVPERHIYNLFISSRMPQKSREDIVHFDLFPTILAFIGVKVPDGPLALGYSGFSSAVSLQEVDRVEDMRNNLLHPSPLYFDLWKQPETSPNS